MAPNLDKIHQAVLFIEEGLAEPLRLSDIAKAAGFSPYHFHRTFGALVGESVKEYIRKRRLAEAAKTLRTTDKKIVDVALDARFETHETFTRAFKRVYGLNPHEYRNGRRDSTFLDKEPLSFEQIAHMQSKVTLEPRFVEREAFRVAGLGGAFDMDDYEEICAHWERFNEVGSGISGAIGKATYGMCCDHHREIRKSDSEQFCYIVGVEIDAAAAVPKGLVDLTVPKQKYAVFTHSGPMRDFIHTLNYIWGTWLLKPGNEKAEGPDFELYDHRFSLTDSNNQVDVYVPVK